MDQKLPEGFRIEERTDKYGSFVRLFSPEGKCYGFLSAKTARQAAEFGPEFVKSLSEGCNEQEDD